MSAASLRLWLLTRPQLAWFCCWQLLIVSALAAQARAQYQFDRWTTDNGLPDNSISSVVQTRDGYLWLTTFDGLVRFDGVRFTIFNASNTPALKSNQFINLLEDRAGNLWASTENSGLVKYQAGVFTSFPPSTAMRHNWWQRLLEDEDGSILLYTDAGPFRLKDGAYISLKPGTGADWQGVGFRGAAGAIWHAAQTGLHRSLNGRVVRSVTADWLGEVIINSFYEDQWGELWLWTDSRYLRHYKDEQWTAYTIANEPPEAGVRAIYADSQGELWLGTTSGRLLRFREGQFTEQPLPFSLAKRAITSVCEDREGSLWFGSFGGLYRLRPQMLMTYTEADGLTTNNIYPIYQDRQDRIWLGGWSGLTAYEVGRFTRYSLEDFKLVQKESDARGSAVRPKLNQHPAPVRRSRLRAWRKTEPATRQNGVE